MEKCYTLDETLIKRIFLKLFLTMYLFIFIIFQKSNEIATNFGSNAAVGKLAS